LESNLRSEINEAISNFRKQLSDQQEHSLYYETMLDTVDSSILITNSKGIIQWMNQTAVQELIGHRIHSLEELNVLNKDFSQKLHSLQPGEVKVIRLYKEDFIQEMAATITNYTNRTENLRLISLKNLRSILEENEMEAWQKLIRVLTHEIMNSITPIISLSDTLSERINKKEKDEYENEMIYQGMQTIHRRSKGLLEFVKNYRQLSRLSNPILTHVRIGDILGDIRKLYPNQEVEYIYQIENEEQILMWDRSQMEQVLINLLKNATEACEGRHNSKVYITTQYLKDKQIFQLTVTDNGCGVLPEALDKIFVPFFTTKTKGSGIGLSLCKQIVNNHGGSISVSSETNKGTSFVLKFLCK
jgi:nitrogen fixation/metabolism regulation signal transduction histidine kinase